MTAARRTAAAASVPDATPTPCQANRFVFGMPCLCPERVAVTRRGLPWSAPGSVTAMIGFLLSMFVIGIIAGFLARCSSPDATRWGSGRRSCSASSARSSAGSSGYVLFGKDLDEGALQASGIIGSIIGAVIALLIYRAITRNRRGTLHR